VTLQWRAGDSETWATTETRDVGVGGAFLLAVAASIGAPIELAIAIPHRALPLRVATQVRWSSPAGIGVQFLGLDIDDVLELNAFLATLVQHDVAAP
jgi:Tfp pilus assembly protein PilZ